MLRSEAGTAPYVEVAGGLGFAADSEDGGDVVDSDDGDFAEASEAAGFASPVGGAFDSAVLESEELAADLGA